MPQIVISHPHRYFPLINSESGQPELVEVDDPGQIPSGESGNGFNNYYSYSVNTGEISIDTGQASADTDQGSVATNRIRYMFAGANAYEQLRYVLPDYLIERRNEHIESRVFTPTQTHHSLLPERPVQNGHSIEQALDHFTQSDQNGILPEELINFSLAFSDLSREFEDSLDDTEKTETFNLRVINFEQRAQTLVNIIREQGIDLLLLARTRVNEYEAIMKVFTREGLNPRLVMASQGGQVRTRHMDVMESTDGSLISSMFIQFNREGASSNVRAEPVDLTALNVLPVDGYALNQNMPAAVDIRFADEQTVRLISALTPPRQQERDRTITDIETIVTHAESSSVMPFYSFKSDSHAKESEQFVEMGGKAITDIHPIIFLRDGVGGRFPYNADSQEAKLFRRILRRYWDSSPSFDDPYSIKLRTPGDDNDRDGSGLGGGISTGS
ncbi:hypothetical protein NX722_22945 [Endozoicomonas gorgoniicola]|uniref:Uncharacterized protein n=1 Tax=Endozoicomonas gorgoniicola TaxID=1234144 RepID=A0ABT3N1B4_9GAMM|nr:hypothetical protein [Endozoicomonas gorgoniicola]MCW7555430.1 hypothetical protein [Endozoicomonas gorgoniicola]